MARFSSAWCRAPPRVRRCRRLRYTFPSPDLNTPAITIRGENLTIDFNGAELAGAASDRAPDGYTGLGVLIDGGQKVTVKNAVIRGLKVGILTRKAADLHLPPGDYTLQVISDDSVRVWVDGALMIDSWEPHESKVDRTPITGGQRRFKVEYYEAGGFAELRFEIQRR